MLLTNLKPYLTSSGCTEGSLQLVGSSYYSDPSENLLEICLNHTVGTACGLTWGEMETVVACRELGYDSGLSNMEHVCKYSSFNYNIYCAHTSLGEANSYGYGSGELEVYNIECNGSEANLKDCTVTRVTDSCSHNYDIQLNCYGNSKNNISYSWYVQR